MKKPEILAPAGDLEKLKIAVLYGADAVYLAGRHFGMRAFAGNFTEEEMQEGVAFARRHGAKVYVTLNIFASNNDIRQLPVYLQSLARIGVDALIIADPGVFSLAREVVPEISIHISTQANTTNWQSARFWQGMGAERVVLAREVTLPEMVEIRSRTEMELEVFVHGAMCWAYSGRCYLSHHLAGRSGNRGECAQACRWKYSLVEEKHPGKYLPVFEDDRGIYILNARDLCLLAYLPDLVKAGVNSFKIEGRMKSVFYVATVTRVYRQALDAFFADREHFTEDPLWQQELHKVSHRPYSSGFLLGNPGEDGQEFSSTQQLTSHEFVGIIRAYDRQKKRAVVEMRNRFAENEFLSVFGPTTEPQEFKVANLTNSMGEPIQEAIRVQEHVSLDMPIPVAEYSLLRRERRRQSPTLD
ncbi:MAG: U32 family peptidase [Dethiobacter sp.]|nr:U32 family peptidase [Dethiobacter sp.]MCL4464342.1 U32 family peptidase [Bacillota bacterium]MCL5993794.1 U32 family peptidase [Bacillota bacterium]